MSKQDKRLAKMCSSPPPSDFTWRELKGTLESLGYEELQGNGSRVKFANESSHILSLHKPHPKEICGRTMIKTIVEELRNQGYKI